MMTPEQRQLAQDLVIVPPSGRRKISKDDFAARFPAALNGGKLSSDLLDDAIEDKSAEDFQSALIIGHVFGFAPHQEASLCSALSADWHMSHEDVVLALESINASSDQTVGALYDATQKSFPYLAYDGSRALAVKVIWALGKIAGSHAEAKLRSLVNSENPILRSNAEEQLRRRLAGF